ncbi:dual specificity phosphatase, catalytic domain containing protein [Babesia divergens]|uniref:protein-tyrosine-phosphatase n=1 Tax=Babesia divergens TaxID=32595 RepID=A0AAD9LEE0_BABDI|nr:dual specificity phosphatase, catalytic domain containing protein [Babesia divergens]
MSKVTPVLYVGDFYTSHRLFDDEHNLPLTSQSPDHQDSSYQIKGVISACFDVPEWCCRSAGCFLKDATYENDAFNELRKSPYFDQSYIDLHVDCISRNGGKEGSSVSGKDAGSTYVVHAVIPAEDGPNECLFRAFAFTYDFVEAVQALEHGSTYIHCMMGMSRSCTLVSSYLMKKRKEAFTAVIKQLKNVHPIASPSAGFICQLILYRKHGFEIKSNKQFCLEYRKLLHNIDLHKLEDYESLDVERCAENEDGAVYSCMKCRQTLFYGYNILRHENAEKATAGSREPCSSVFVEPMDWMTGVDTQTGKIVCKNARCCAKLGSYCWYGRRCSCGHLQVPAFQIQLSKVDKLITESSLGGKAPVRNEDLLL